jgi:hypothetical protein
MTEKTKRTNMRTGTVYLVLERGRYPYDLRVAGIRQSEPSLQKGQRAVKIALEVDDAIWEPQITPGTTIRVNAPLMPDPVVLISELPQAPWPDPAAKAAYDRAHEYDEIEEPTE